MQTATSISVLKGITGTSNEIAILLGAVTPGDGGGGTFYYDSASIETQNDGTIVKPTAVTNGRWKRIFSDTINVKWFASKVVSGNWSPAFQAGIDLGNSIFIPSGSYRIDTPLTNNGDTSVVGESVSTVTLYTTSDINIFNFTNNGLITIRNLQLVASLAQTTGAAINIQSPGGVRRVGIIENIRILRTDPPHTFKYGIKIKNPRELVLRDILIEGNGSTTMVGIYLSSDQSAVSPTLENVKVYDAKIGLQIVSNSNPSNFGIEGVKISGSDFAGVDIGVLVDNTFGGPGFNFDNCHVNAFSGCISITNMQQVFITDCLVYMNGTGFNYGITFEGVSEASITSSKFFFIGSGNVYGILCNSSQTRNIKVAHNYFKLNNTGNQTGIWFGSNSSRNQALYNSVEGVSNGYDVFDQGSNNVLAGNIRFNTGT